MLRSFKSISFRANLLKAAGQSSSTCDPCFSARSTKLLPKQIFRCINMADPEVVPITIDGRLYRTVREGQANILAPYSKDNDKSKKPARQSGQPRNNDEGDQAVFYNPIQQYNRDLSVLAILIYGESALQLKREKHQQNVKIARQKRKHKATSAAANTSRDHSLPTPAVSESPSKKRSLEEAGLDSEDGDNATISKRSKDNQTEETTDTEVRDGINGCDQPTSQQAPDVHGQTKEPGSGDTVKNTKHEIPFTVLDALSASGLRAIRYAKEIPFATTIIANDYSSEAVRAIDLNIQHNELNEKVFSNQGDARQFMYSKTGNESAHKGPAYVHKFDVVDLDPYGTAAPFLDAAIQAVADGGMLCVTCTDGGVWASNGYPEKAYAIYAGIPLKGPQSHEAGLRIILHSIAVSAAKYGVAIEPLLSLSIDFYARLFIRVHKSQQDVKLMAGTTMLVYNCDQGCGAWETQLVARNQDRKAKNGDTYYKYGFAQAPSADKFCEHCGTKTHLGGPMWAGPLHNPVFIQKILDRVPVLDKTIYGTTDRIKGMLTVALEEEDMAMPASRQDDHSTTIRINGSSMDTQELPETSSMIPRLPAHLISTQPFFFLPTYLAKVLSLPTPSDDPLRGAFLGLGYACTRSHCKPGSFKTNAPWNVIWEVIREWARQKQPGTLPRLLGEGEFEGKASVKKSSPGAKILRRLRNRADDTMRIAQLRESLLEKLGDGPRSMNVERAGELRDLLTSTLYDLEHVPAKLAQSLTESNGGISNGESTDNNAQPQKISGKALIENGGDPSELDIVFDAERGRAFRESKGGKLVRYQINPRPNWGPMVRAGAGT